MPTNGHSLAFQRGGRCIWCQATPERVADRRAPPWCPGKPEELREDDDGRAFRNQTGGY